MQERRLQQQATELPADGWDVVIVGAGPAGATAAIVLARAGYAVALLDRECFPREKVCGDALIADAHHCLARLGLLEEVEAIAHPVHRASLYSPSQVRVEVPGEFLTLKRFRFDERLARAAVGAGASFAVGRVTRCATRADGTIDCHLGERRLHARVAVLATGAGVKLGRELGLVTEPAPSAVAVRQYVRSRRGPDEMVISYDRSVIPGYAWIFPLGGGEYNVGCGTFRAHRQVEEPRPLRAMLERFFAEFPVARELRAAADACSPLRGAPLRCGLTGASPVGDGNLLVVGESIGSTYPLTGEGIGKSMETGALAAEVIHDALRTADFERLRRFETRLEAEVRPSFRGFHTAERWLARAWFADFFARRCQRSEFLRDFLSGLFANEVDARQAFSIGGLARSFLG